MGLRFEMIKQHQHSLSLSSALFEHLLIKLSVPPIKDGDKRAEGEMFS